jgi:hypothetical protein
VLDPYDPDQAAGVLAGHVRDELWLTGARAAAHRLAVEQFSRDLLFERFEAVLNRSAATAGRRRTAGRAVLSEPS